MKMYEALSMLCAAKEGGIPVKETAVKQFGEKSKRALRIIGLKKKDIYGEYPDSRLRVDLFFICHFPAIFREEARAAEQWFLSRN